MPRKFVLLAALFAAGHSQFLRPHGNGFTSSFTSSSSWFQGNDGQMHKQTQESRTEMVQDTDGMKRKKTEKMCRDGDCTEVVEVIPQGVQEPRPFPGLRPMAQAVPPGFTALMQSEMPAEMARLQGLMQRLAGGHFASVPTFSMEKPVVTMVFPEQAPQVIAQPPMVSDSMPIMGSNAFLGPQFKILSDAPDMSPIIQPSMFGPAMDRLPPLPEIRVYATPMEMPKNKQEKSNPNDLDVFSFLSGANLTTKELAERNMLLVESAWISCGIFGFFTMVFTILKWRQVDSDASARERPLQALAEPLAPSQTPMAVGEKRDAPAAPTKAAEMKSVVSAYLDDLYFRSAVKAYLSRVYGREVA